MIFERFSLQRKKPELCNIYEMLKSNFFSKNKNFRNTLFKYIYRPLLFHSYYVTEQFNSQSMGQTDKRKAA